MEDKHSSKKGPLVLLNQKVPNTHLEKFRKIVETKYNENFDSYFDLHQWSIENFPCFWKEIWHYFEVVHSKLYERVYEKTGPGFLDCKWFPGARFNLAENLLKIRDNSTAIIYVDEYGCEEHVTFAEMFDEVQLYAAAFKKQGLRKGDMVACYMSNRKESVFAYLAASSIGAIFGGPQPYLKSKVATKVLNRMEAKFLFSIDHHSDNGVEFHNIEHLQDIALNAPCLEKIIIVPTKPDTLCRDLSSIRNCCLLGDFLASGRNPDGKVPDLEFEQLPFDHPITVGFTSGTTGLPKGPVHSAGTLITPMVNIVLHWNLNKGDVLYTKNAVGWNVWNVFIPCLARGVTLLLYAGSPTYERQGIDIWDIFAKFRVTFAFLNPCFLDVFEKNNVVPKPYSNLKHLKVLAVGGSPTKPQNYIFLRNKIKEDLFIFDLYGCTECMASFSGMDTDLPTLAGEVQAPNLGLDVRCFDENGQSVVNKSGEMVIATPLPSLPVCLWKDEGNKILQETYLSKFPGVWHQGDEIWINPVSRGFVVKGRTDDTIKQYGQRFLPSDIYNAIHNMEEIEDSICVNHVKESREVIAVLFIKMKNGYHFTDAFKKKVEENIENDLYKKCVPELILEIKDIPYNLNCKKMESVVRKIIATNQVPDVDNIKNPQSLEYYCGIPEILNY